MDFKEMRNTLEKMANDNFEDFRAIGQKVLIKIAIHIDNSMSVAI